MVCGASYGIILHGDREAACFLKYCLNNLQGCLLRASRDYETIFRKDSVGIAFRHFLLTSSKFSSLRSPFNWPLVS